MIPVVTISTREPDPIRESYYQLPAFRKSCARRDIMPIFLPTDKWGGLISKPKLFLAWLEGHTGVEHVIFCDSWDILFTQTPSEIVEKFKTFGKPIVFNAERSCFPRADLTEQFPKCGTPYRYLNSGFIVGERTALIDMLKGMKLDECIGDYQKQDGSWYNTNDQENFQLWWLANQDKAALDTSALICQSLHEAGPDEFYVDPPQILSRLTGNRPSVFHGNGSGKAWLKKIIDWMGF